MICDNCDAKNLDHREICWKCGEPLSQQPAAYPSTIVPKTSIEQKSTIYTPTKGENRMGDDEKKCIDEEKETGMNPLIKLFLLVFFGTLAVIFILFVIGSHTNSAVSPSPAGYQVKVIYPGTWRGALGTDDSTKTFSGTGTTTYDIQNPKHNFGCSVGKQDGSSQRLTVELLKDGYVLKSEFTDDPYGSVTIVTIL